MASPSYGIDVVALAFAVVLAAVLALLLSHLVPQFVELIRKGAPNAARRKAPDAFAASGVRDSLKRFLTGLILRGVVLLGPFSLGFHCGQSSTECSHPCGDSRFLSYSL